MPQSYEQIFLALAVKNKLLTKEQAQEVLKAFHAEGGRIAEVAILKGFLKADHARMLDAGVAQVQKGETGTLRVQRTPAPAGAPDPKEPIPGYAITGKLGVGGTATVFLAIDRKNGERQVALKILKPALAQDPKALRSFLREAELLTQMRHPNIVQGYDFGTAGPLSFLALEYLEGESAYDVLEREKSFTEARALEVILEAAKAIDFIQKQGYIHRDIKPDNLMLTKDNRIVLCDLGFAIPIAKDSGEEPLREETTSGTVQYMSPEQAKGQMDLDVRSDIYSLGATLYHLVMGDVPFQGGDSMEVMAKQVLEALSSTEIKNRRISRHMHYFIERMMSKDKDLRYANPEELVEDINAQIEGFKSLEYRPEEEEAQPESNILQAFQRGRRPDRRDPSSRLGKPRRKLDKDKLAEITRRRRKRR